jgi:cytochrome c-type biogenesis protein CcmH
MIVLVLVFGLVTLLASAFVVLPLLRRRRAVDEAKARVAWLALGGGLGVAAVGLGFYAFLGQPQIALSALRGPSTNDYPALIATLAQRMPQRPDDLEGWTLLGRGYMAYGNTAQAAKAFGRAVAIAKAQLGAAPPQLLSSYGEALTQDAGEVSKDAEAVFREAVREDPSELMARYYLGLALSSRGDKNGALQLWESVLADAPPNVPWRRGLVDQIAGLKAQTGGAAPNPLAMVAQLASRLENDPNDLNGWLMLIRAYSVLGDKDKASAALGRARTVFANQTEAQAQLAQSAKEFSLN